MRDLWHIIYEISSNEQLNMLAPHVRCLLYICAERTRESKPIFFPHLYNEFARRYRECEREKKKRFFTYPVVIICLTCKHRLCWHWSCFFYLSAKKSTHLESLQFQIWIFAMFSSAYSIENLKQIQRTIAPNWLRLRFIFGFFFFFAIFMGPINLSFYCCNKSRLKC